MRRSPAWRAPERIADVWVLVLALAVLWPALAGWLDGGRLVLTYDMVWVPDLALTASSWGAGPGVPRAVPGDLVVGLLDEVVPGALLQLVVLLGALVALGTGMHRLAAPRHTAARVAVAGLAVVNPFVVERVVLGHWTMLLALAVAPWLLLIGRRLRERRDEPAGGRPGALAPSRTVALAGGAGLVAVGSLSATAGIATAAVALAAVARARAGRLWSLAVAGIVLALNAPWLVAGWLADAVAPSAEQARVAAEVFAARGTESIPTPVALLGLGGVWNSEVVPASLDGVGAWLWALIGLAGVVGLLLARRTQRDLRIVLGVLALIGVAPAVLSWAAPGVGAALASALPGGGILRDGSRLMGLAVPGVLVGAAALLDGVLDRLLGESTDAPPGATTGGARRVAPATAAAVVAALLPLALVPDAVGGVGGRLQAVAYPDDVARVRAVLDVEQPDGAVLSLPFASYRAPVWNGGRPVLDPVPRLLGRDVVASDELVVAGSAVAGEDPRGPGVRAALALATPGERSAALREIGITAVVRARSARDDSAPAALNPALAGRVAVAGDDFELELLGSEPDAAPSSSAEVRGVRLLSWVAPAVVLAAAGIAGLGAAIRRRTRA